MSHLQLKKEKFSSIPARQPAQLCLRKQRPKIVVLFGPSNNKAQLKVSLNKQFDHVDDI
jgi:hypothetical protein